MQRFVYTLVTVGIERNDPLRPTTIALGCYSKKVDAETEFNLYCERMQKEGLKVGPKIQEYARFESETTVFRVHILCSEFKE